MKWLPVTFIAPAALISHQALARCGILWNSGQAGQEGIFTRPCGYDSAWYGRSRWNRHGGGFLSRLCERRKDHRQEDQSSTENGLGNEWMAVHDVSFRLSGRVEETLVVGPVTIERSEPDGSESPAGLKLDVRKSSGDREIRRAGRNQEAHLVSRFRYFTRYGAESRHGNLPVHCTAAVH